MKDEITTLKNQNPDLLTPSNTSYLTYNDRTDAHAFIKKLRIDDSFKITNQTQNPVDLLIQLESKETSTISEIKLTISTGETYHFRDFNNSKLWDVTTTHPEGNQTGYLTPIILIGGMLKINIQEQLDPLFLYKNRYDFFFHSKKFDGYIYEDGSSSLTYRQRFYNDLISFFDHITSVEGLRSIGHIDQQRNELYAKNNMAQLLKQNPNLFHQSLYKTPLITHKIWVTTYDNPLDPPDHYIKWLENSIEYNPPSEGWTHYFWIENRIKQESLYTKLKNHPAITVMELDSLQFETGSLYKNILQEKPRGYAGQASDIVRLEVLRQFGGFYLDTDYEVFQSLKPLGMAYDLVMGLDPIAPFLGNAFMSAKPHHPFMDKSLDLIKRNLSGKGPHYTKRENVDNMATLILTGPIMASVAFAATAGQNNNIDIVLPPQLIYPSQKETYPTWEIVVPGGKMPPQCVGAHYWDNAWTDPRFVEHT